MFSDFYEKFNFKKTTPEEKKEVVKNTGKYFPENHSNKIKGMDELAEAVVNNAMKKQDEILSMRPAKKGYMWKKCAICGETFESYRGTQKYCSAECLKKGNLKCQKEYQKRKKEKEAMANKYKRCPICDKAFVPNYTIQKYCCGKCAKEAENKRQREAYRKRALEGKTYYQTYKSSEAIKNEEAKQVPQAVLSETMHATDETIELEALEIAVNIVRRARAEEDVKLAVDATYKTIRGLLSR